MKITDFELVDLGIENSQYFQGFGCAFSSYSEACYGIGDTPREALDDCLEMVAQLGVDNLDDIEKQILAAYPDFENDRLNAKNSVSKRFPDSEDTYYHIGLRFNTEE